MTSQVDLAALTELMPEGVKPGSDVSSLTVGTVLGLDIAAGMVQVTVAGSEPVWVAAAPFIYEAGVKVRLRRSPLNGGRLEYCEGPLTVSPTIVTGTVLEVNEETLRVSVLGGEADLMFASSTYDVDDQVLVLRHATGFGVPQAVLGLAGIPQEAVDPGAGQVNPGQMVTRQATISPQDSGTWRAGYGWDAWNPNAAQHGGKPSLWQGNDYGSGQLTGWAGYGDQVVNLSAARITRMWVDITRADSSVTASRELVVQGSPNGSRPNGVPGGSGDLSGTGPLPRGGFERIQLPESTFEAWRTGGFKGLRTVGPQYMAAAGTNRGGGMTLTVQYEVVA